MARDGRDRGWSVEPDELGRASVGHASEVEAVADALQALFRAELLRPDTRTVGKACRVVGIPREALAEAAKRWNEGRWAPPSERHHLPVPPSTGAKRPRQRAETERRCLRCGETRPIEDFPFRRRSEGRRRSKWCTLCSNDASVRKVQAWRVEHRVALRVEVLDGDPIAGLLCPHCGDPLRPGQIVITVGEPVHAEHVDDGSWSIEEDS